MNIRHLLAAICLSAGVPISTPVFAQETQCDSDKPVVFAGFDWDSAAFHNGVARYILEKGYGCETDQIPGATIPLFNGMFRGNVDVAMEIWTQSVDKVWTDALEKGVVREIGTNIDDAVQAFFIPRYLVEGPDAPAPDLKTVADLKKYKDLFKDPEEPEKGRFYNCVLGWSCANVNTKKLYAYGLSEDFVDFRPGSGNATTSAAESALRRHKAVFFYYWTPSWLVGKYKDDLIILEEPPYNEATWEAFMASDHPDKATAYPKVNLNIGVNSRFADRAPVVVDFLSKYHTNSDIVSQMLSYMQSNDASAEEAAAHFLKTHPEVWVTWVPEDVAERIQASLPE